MCNCFSVNPVQALADEKILIDKIGMIKVSHKKNDANGKIYANVQEYILNKQQLNSQPADLNNPDSVFGAPSEPIF